MKLRPYQSDCIAAVNAYLAEHDDNPLAVLPTASGKTVIFASMIRDWLTRWPGTRVLILSHVKELLTQAEAKLTAVWPAAPVGIWSAGVGRKEGHRPVTIAGIQSIYKRAHDFDPWEIVIVDEAHLIPVEGEGMYRRFLADARKANPHVRVIGFTATPFRLKGGHIARPDYILNEVCYEADIAELIRDGHLATLRSKATANPIDTSGVGTSKGDFIQAQLERAANTEPAVAGAVDEIVAKGADRHAWLIFACGVDHAYAVSSALRRRGVEAPVVVGDTDAGERDRILANFDAGRLRAVVNVNCLTTGLDVTRIDLIALLRPTQSVSLYVQMVGRGFRLHPGKTDCLVLDFGGNVRRHGPIDRLCVKHGGGPGEGAPGEAPVKECPECHELMFAGLRECPACGFLFPEPEVKHEAKADATPILATSAEDWEVEVVDVQARAHVGRKGIPMLVVDYFDAVGTRHREFVCLQHDGYALAKARRWWERRFGLPVPATVDEALGRELYLAHSIKEMTPTIVSRWAPNGGRDVVDCKLRNDAVKAMAR